MREMYVQRVQESLRACAKMNGLTPEQSEMMMTIFARYHVARIDPTPQFVAQASFDIGWLQGLIMILAKNNPQTMVEWVSGLNRPS